MENKDVQNLLEDLISEFEEMDIDDNLNESQIDSKPLIVL